MSNSQYYNYVKPCNIKEYLWSKGIIVKKCPRCSHWNDKQYSCSVWDLEDRERERIPRNESIMCSLCFTIRKCIEHFKTTINPGTYLPDGISVDYWYWEKVKDRTDRPRKYKIINNNTQLEIID